MAFAERLEQSGWIKEGPFGYRKGSWRIVIDTSSWMEVGTDRTQRIFDVPMPDADREQWTMNLIEHLCKTDDELQAERRR